MLGFQNITPSPFRGFNSRIPHCLECPFWSRVHRRFCREKERERVCAECEERLWSTEIATKILGLYSKSQSQPYTLQIAVNRYNGHACKIASKIASLRNCRSPRAPRCWRKPLQLQRIIIDSYLVAVREIEHPHGIHKYFAVWWYNVPSRME